MKCFRYFQFLNEGSRLQLKVMCLKCWSHIDDFYQFNLQILSTDSEYHNNIEDEVKSMSGKRKLYTDKEVIDIKKELNTTAESDELACRQQDTKRIKLESEKLIPENISAKPSYSNDIKEEDFEISFSVFESIDIQFNSDDKLSMAESEESNESDTFELQQKGTSFEETQITNKTTKECHNKKVDSVFKFEADKSSLNDDASKEKRKNKRNRNKVRKQRKRSTSLDSIRNKIMLDYMEYFAI